MYWRNKALVLPGRLSADSQIGQKQYASVLSWLSVTSQSPYYIDISAMHCDFIMHLLTVWQWVACHWPISTMHMSPVHWQQWPSMHRGTAEAGPCNYYNSYRFPRIIIVTLQLTFCSITWPTHLPSHNFYECPLTHMTITWCIDVKTCINMKAELRYIIESIIVAALLKSPLVMFSHRNSQSSFLLS